MVFMLRVSITPYALFSDSLAIRNKERTFCTGTEIIHRLIENTYRHKQHVNRKIEQPKYVTFKVSGLNK